jgi:hypothetical protein
MRLLCDADVRSRAHVTVRGPYGKKPDAARAWRNVKDIVVSIDRIGTFFEGRQNTVFLECKSSRFEDLWWKRDYKKGVPHITIYDGKSREFAQKIASVLDRYTWQTSFVADQLQEYVSTGPQVPLDLRWSQYSNIFRLIFGATMSRDDLRLLNEEVRLKQLDQVAKFFLSSKNISDAVSADAH